MLNKDEYIGKHFIISSKDIYLSTTTITSGVRFIDIPETGKIRNIRESKDNINKFNTPYISVEFYHNPPYGEMDVLVISEESFLKNAIIADTESAAFEVYRLLREVQ